MDKSAKILLLGKTGVGKSSFVNYFVGKNVAASGKGKPVTQGVFLEYECTDGKYLLKIYDNQGFEAETAYRQKDLIISKVKEHNNSSDIFNWFHTIFYCVSAWSRFEPFEAEFVKDLSRSISQNIHIILTKCDGLGRATIEEKKEYIRKELKKYNIDAKIFEIVSIETKKRSGEAVVPRGKEELSASVFRLLWQDISEKISLDYAKELNSDLSKTLNSIFSDIGKIIDKTCKVSAILSGENENEMDSMLSDLEGPLNDRFEECNQKYNEIMKPISELFSNYSGIEIDDFLGDFFEFSLDDFAQDLESVEIDDEIKKQFPSMNKVSEDSANFFDFIGSGFELLTIRSRVHKVLDSMKYDMIVKIPSVDKISQDSTKQLMKLLDKYC